MCLLELVLHPSELTEHLPDADVGAVQEITRQQHREGAGGHRVGAGPGAAGCEVHNDQLRLPQLRIEFRMAPQVRVGHGKDGSKDAGVLVAAEVVQRSTSGSKSKEDATQFFKRVGARARWR